MRRSKIFSIGHSNREIDEFVRLLRRHRINALCDVRSVPFSRFFPQYNRRELRCSLKSDDIEYVFLGKELGGRPSDRSLYDAQGRVCYENLARTPLFEQGMQRLSLGLEKQYILAIMCSERDPIDCHRAILIGRFAAQLGWEVEHVLDEGKTESQQELERRLVEKLRLYPDMLRGDTPDSLIQRAYELQGERIAFSELATEGE